MGLQGLERTMDFGINQISVRTAEQRWMEVMSMADRMDFAATVEEFMEQYKITDTEYLALLKDRAEGKRL